METSKCPLPMCMMPDGADPCEGYQALRHQLAQREEQRDKALGVIVGLRCKIAALEAEVALLDAVEGYADNCHDHGIVTLDVGVVRRILDRRERSSDGEAGKSV